MTENEPLIVYFPSLRPESAGALPAGVRLLDPGIAPDSPALYRPASLPLDQSAAQGRLREFIRFGEQFKDSKDLSFFGAVGMEDFYSGSTQSIRSDLASISSEDRRDKAEEERREASAKAQVALLLTWSLEERVGEMAELNKKVEAGWTRFGQSLGLDADTDEDDLAEVAGLSAAAPTVALDDEVDWRRVLEAMLVLLPADAVLLTDRRTIIEDLEEFGVVFSAVEGRELEALGLAGQELPGRLLAARASGHRLLARRRQETRPWLDAERTVLFLDRDAAIRR